MSLKPWSRQTHYCDGTGNWWPPSGTTATGGAQARPRVMRTIVDIVAALVLHKCPRRGCGQVGQTTALRGIAFGGDAAVAKVFFRSDGGGQWKEARLGPDRGKYSFRRWEVLLRPTSPGPQRLMIKAQNT